MLVATTLDTPRTRLHATEPGVPRAAALMDMPLTEHLFHPVPPQQAAVHGRG